MPYSTINSLLPSHLHIYIFIKEIHVEFSQTLISGDIVSDPNLALYLDSESPYRKIATFLKVIFFKDVKTSLQLDDIGSAFEQFPYKVDEDIFKNLAKLHGDRVKDFPKPEERKEVETNYQFGYYSKFSII